MDEPDQLPTELFTYAIYSPVETGLLICTVILVIVALWTRALFSFPFHFLSAIALGAFISSAVSVAWIFKVIGYAETRSIYLRLVYTETFIKVWGAILTLVCFVLLVARVRRLCTKKPIPLDQEENK